jgi:hypothetical protein
MLYLHQCLPAPPSLCFMFFFLSCSVHHVPSMHHSSSVHFSCCTLLPSTHLNHSQQQLISSLFCIFILSVHLLHPLFTMLLHALPMLSALPNHNCNSSASLAIKPLHPSSLCVMSRLLSLSSSQDSSFSLSQSSSFPLLQFQAPTVLHLSISSMNSLHATGRCLETLHLLWQSP